MRKIQLCCGTNKLPGWENYDAEVDLTKLPLPFPNACAEMVFIEHGLEHFTGPQGFRILEEAHRILIPTGKLRVCVPQLRNLPQPKAKDIILNHGHLMVYCRENLLCMMLAAGFSSAHEVGRDPIDSHWKVIGMDQDDLETLRMETIK
jgi:predicted SAM-dependent methyltransferase